MRRKAWLDKLLDSVADRGRELLRLGRGPEPDVATLCHALLAGRGEASSLAIARDLVRRCEHMGPAQRVKFLELLYRRFGPDPDRIKQAAKRYCADPDDASLLTLASTIESPRQELFRRMNMAPEGTRALVALRGELLGLIGERPHLRTVDADLKHLLFSWFNRGFLRLERIDWHSPADVLERLIRYEAVHAIQGWQDLRRRLEADRRCFAFFHPALPDEPLIFVEVAFTKGLPDNLDPLLSCDAAVLDPAKADTAVFYSISNTQRGLRGISFGSFLIKQVLEDFGREPHNLKRFATLSPMPHLRATIEAAARGEHVEFTRARMLALLQDRADTLITASGKSDPIEAFLMLAQRNDPEHRALVGDLLRRLALAYLAFLPGRVNGYDPVAAFHLSNGARLQRINVFADSSPHGLRSAYGVMVNYHYDPGDVEINHEKFAAGEICMSRRLLRMRQKLARLWEEPGEDRRRHRVLRPSERTGARAMKGL